MKKLNLALLGFGHAGQAFAKMLLEKKDQIEKSYQRQVEVTALSTKTKGALSSPSGINLERALAELENLGKFDPLNPDYTQMTGLDMIRHSDYDLLLELSPLHVETGQPAILHIKEAFLRSKHVITANKGPIAWAYEELTSMAKERNLLFYYETTVMDGTPIFTLVDHSLKFCQITEVSGILNSTTNFILEEMAKGRDYAHILREGQERGFIEANPAMDIEGFDAAAKITALLNVLMGANISPLDVERQGIEGISLKDIQEAASRGNVIKLVCQGKKEDGQTKAWVKPMEIPKGHILASVDSTSSLVSLTTDLMGKLTLIEHAPEIKQTAYGIFGDLLRVLDNLS